MTKQKTHHGYLTSSPAPIKPFILLLCVLNYHKRLHMEHRSIDSVKGIIFNIVNIIFIVSKWIHMCSMSSKLTPLNKRRTVRVLKKKYMYENYGDTE